MKKDLYRHKKTGNLYSLVSDKLAFKDYEPGMDGLEWRRNLILYKAEYDCPDGPYFVRMRSDFFENFEKVKNRIIKNVPVFDSSCPISGLRYRQDALEESFKQFFNHPRPHCIYLTGQTSLSEAIAISHNEKLKDGKVFADFEILNEDLWRHMNSTIGG